MSVKILSQMSLVFFFDTEKRNKIKLCHLENGSKFFATPRHESLALVKTKDTENTGRFGKSWKKVIPRKALFFFVKTFHLDEPFHLNFPWH